MDHKLKIVKENTKDDEIERLRLKLIRALELCVSLSEDNITLHEDNRFFRI